MLVQIYEITSPEEARALGELGVDHIGVLVGDGSFPRERTIDQARLIFSAIPPTSKGSALLLSADLELIARVVSELKPAILHLGASTDLLTPATVQDLKQKWPAVTVMRSIPVVDQESIAIAESYDRIADMLLLDTHRPGDIQIGALGMTHDWEIDKKIVESTHIPVIIAGGLGPDNVVDAVQGGSTGWCRFKNQDRQGGRKSHQRFATGKAVCRARKIFAENQREPAIARSAARSCPFGWVCLPSAFMRQIGSIEFAEGLEFCARCGPATARWWLGNSENCRLAAEATSR